ncbi:hypothetical protein VM98_20620 [Streptomyces rubellomurinus subsp. indigoferus]|nr:hypothetical protein VM98_20620 [Streptomyces rubellomurinus subsp. indigoferus]
MGVDITVVAVDWAHLRGIAPDARLPALEEAAYDEVAVEAGWVWPVEPGRAWLGRYEFARSCGSYTPHFRAGEAWGNVRDAAGPALRAALDGFLLPLFWYGPGREAAAHVEPGVLPAGDRTERYGPLVAAGPGTVARLDRCWREASPALPELREPFGRLAADPGGWIEDYEDFARLLSGWGEVVGEAGRRGWGVIGLRI